MRKRTSLLGLAALSVAAKPAQVQTTHPGIRENGLLSGSIHVGAARRAVALNILALEEEATGNLVREKEREFYVRISDFEQLKSAANVEKQEQWTIKIAKTDRNSGEGNERVRRVESKDGTVQYIKTTKVVMGSGDRLEVSEPSTEDAFEVFKRLADNGMIKDRYTFPVEGTDLVYEVDMFRRPDGSYAEWAKIDLENPPEQPPALPISVEEFIDGKTQDPAARKKITELYDLYFLTPNVYLNSDTSGLKAPAMKPTATGDSPDAVVPTVPAADASENKKEGGEDQPPPTEDKPKTDTDDQPGDNQDTEGKTQEQPTAPAEGEQGNA